MKVEINLARTTIRKMLQLGFSLFLFFSLPGGVISAQGSPDWNCFHGPERTNKSTETKLLNEWPVK
jgi:hypothetical protein